MIACWRGARVVRRVHLPPSLKLPAAGRRIIIALAAAGQSDRGVNIEQANAAYRRFIVQPASILIAAVGLLWTLQRALS
jgi:hypothetical protein